MDIAVTVTTSRDPGSQSSEYEYSGISQIQAREVMVEKKNQDEKTTVDVHTHTHTTPEYAVSWEPAIADRIRKEALEVATDTDTDTDRPFMVALIGMPGSGKSVSSFLLAAKLEELGCPSMIMPHDGYHYPMDRLKLFPDAPDMIYRRGAPDTFDPVALLRDLRRIRDGDEPWITVPAFDHAKGDPEPNRHAFDRNQHQVVICEGLYLLHDGSGWEDVAAVFDLTIFLKSDLDDCVERVKVRNKCIPGYTPEEIEVRAEQVDRVNAMTVMESMARADIVVEPFINITTSTRD